MCRRRCGVSARDPSASQRPCLGLWSQVVVWIASGVHVRSATPAPCGRWRVPSVQCRPNAFSLRGRLASPVRALDLTFAPFSCARADSTAAAAAPRKLSCARDGPAALSPRRAGAPRRPAARGGGRGGVVRRRDDSAAVPRRADRLRLVRARLPPDRGGREPRARGRLLQRRVQHRLYDNRRLRRAVQWPYWYPEKLYVWPCGAAPLAFVTPRSATDRRAAALLLACCSLAARCSLPAGAPRPLHQLRQLQRPLLLSGIGRSQSRHGCVSALARHRGHGNCPMVPL